jgi:hypothetical protein
MRPERATRPRTSVALVEWLTDALFDLAGDQDVRVIEALAAVLARRWRRGLQSPRRGLSEPADSPRFGRPESDVDTAMRRAICQRIARRALHGSLVDPTRGATAVHRIDVNPAWSRDLLPIGMFGPFLFYRPAPPRGRATDRLGAASLNQQEIVGLDC